MVTASKSKLLIMIATLAMACALSLGFTAQAFASTEVPAYNSYCKISAVANNTQAASLPTTAGSAVATAAESGQYIDVTLTFPSGLPTVTENNATRVLTASEAQAYLQNHIVFAGERNIGTTANYLRMVSDVAIDSSAKTITFKIGAVQGYTTANYKGTLRIDCTPGDLFYSAMNGAKAETLIQSGMALSTSATASSAVVSVTANPLNRGMVHVLFQNNGSTLFTGSSTYQNGIITIHAHSFATMTADDYAAAIASAANTAASESSSNYSFVASTDGSGKVTVTRTGSSTSCKKVTCVVYDGSYLNSKALPVGDIDESEMDND